jgi:hypothetical protein
MAKKEGGLLMTLGKKMLGFSTSSSGCCAVPAAVEPTQRPEAVALDATSKAPDAACCAPSCCSTADPVEAGAKPSV